MPGQTGQTDNVFYHVTTSENVKGIRAAGLIPNIGPRAQKMNEPYPYIYLFHNRDDMEDAVMNWLGDEFDDDETLILCVIHLPTGIINSLRQNEAAAYEIMCPVQIPQKFIEFETL